MSGSEFDSLQSVLQKINSGEAVSPELVDQFLPVLEQFECWAPAFRLISKVITDQNSKNVDHLIFLARVQNNFLEDAFAAAETCTRIVANHNIGFDVFIDDILPRVLGTEEQFSAEIAILSAVETRFSNKFDRVQCLERLCFLFEKKIHNEVLLAQAYERLITLEPNNLRALKYFKVVYTQNNEWEEVVGILQAMVANAVRPQERFRCGQELAAVYLYQLDMPDEAIAVIESHCSESPLDTSSLLYDAHQRQGNLHGCLLVLRECLLNVDDDFSRGIIHLKIADLHEKLGEIDQAFDNYVLASRLHPRLVDAIEGCINIAISKKNWTELLRWMLLLAERIEDESRIKQVRMAISRLQAGINNGYSVE